MDATNEHFGCTGLQSSEAVKLLDILRHLTSQKDLTAGKVVPQIVVIGKRSSGKSSVLQAISGIPFPTGDGISTQFTIEIILRRQTETKRSATIDFQSEKSGAVHRAWQFAERWENFDTFELSEIINDAKNCMELGTNVVGHNRLRIRIYGPEQDDVTLIDLPGLTSKWDWPQTCVDRQAMTQLVREYITQPRSLILAVISGQNGQRNQSIFNMLKDIYNCGTSNMCDTIARILGVVTQPDGLQRHSAREEAFLDLVKYPERSLLRGWHVIRNLSCQEKQEGKERAIVEAEFFKKAVPWCSLPSQVVSVDMLKTRLSQMLSEIMASQLGCISTSVEKKIKTINDELEQLGGERSTAEHHRTFLIKIAGQYSRLVSDALMGEYGNDFFKVESRRLREYIVSRNTSFASVMARHGHTWDIDLDGVNTEDDAFHAEGGQPSSKNGKSQLIQHVRQMLKEPLGLELKDVIPPNIISRLFKEQAEGWGRLATKHLRTVVVYVRNFMESTMYQLVGSGTADILVRKLVRPLMDKKESLLKNKLNELLCPYFKAHPITLNSGYAKRLEELRTRRIQNIQNHGSDPHEISRYVYEEAVEAMQTYYDIALSVFVDNVAMLAIEGCLLSDLPELICPSSIARESVERLTMLGSEPPTTKQYKLKLKMQLQDIEQCQKCVEQFRQKYSRTINDADSHLSFVQGHLIAEAPQPMLDWETPQQSLQTPTAIDTLQEITSDSQKDVGSELNNLTHLIKSVSLTQQPEPPAVESNMYMSPEEPACCLSLSSHDTAICPLRVPDPTQCTRTLSTPRSLPTSSKTEMRAGLPTPQSTPEKPAAFGRLLSSSDNLKTSDQKRITTTKIPKIESGSPVPFIIKSPASTPCRIWDAESRSWLSESTVLSLARTATSAQLAKRRIITPRSRKYLGSGKPPITT